MLKKKQEKIKKTLKLAPSEHDEAVILAEYLSILEDQRKIALYSHIPNETFTKSWKTKLKNKAEGVRPGVPDYIIVTPKKVLFLELKRVKGGVMSFEQVRWITELQGKKIYSGMAKGFDEAKEFIDSHL